MEDKPVRVVEIEIGIGLSPSMKLIIHIYDIDHKFIKLFFNKFGRINYLLPPIINAKEERKRNWLDLPDHILSLVSDLLIDINDYIRFGVVCWPWRRIYTENRSHRTIHHQLPLLVIPASDEPCPCDLKNQTRSFYSLSNKKIIPNFQVRLPHKFCRGSTQGWLVTVDENLSDVSLFNPFLSHDNEIQLPSIQTLPHEEFDIYHDAFLSKAVLSANPVLNPNYVVMAIYGGIFSLAFFKPGDKTWTSPDFEDANMDDVIQFNDQFYVVDCQGFVFSCDVTQPHPELVKVASPPSYQAFSMKKYLVDSFGDLLQISKEIDSSSDDEPYRTVGFEVFKLEQSTLKWTKLQSIGNCAIFLGDNYSMSLSSKDFPTCKPNCIYFTDDYYEGYYNNPNRGPRDMGVFNIKNGSIKQHYPMNSKTIYPPPIWIEPTLERC
ncbi:hypothetical protein AQUCO_01300530v1 [Aquilegia coerulea]|uniref:KIB1-4 beta-propeller domain-containing protein n=1 Tax=Aquilegia coerulea TaxID=218851 RepID=A0A2G5E257_AQUCA|nr:hypothetical protein AQUCO_01300530v1 [Aquilegia coerulea]